MQPHPPILLVAKPTAQRVRVHLHQNTCAARQVEHYGQVHRRDDDSHADHGWRTTCCLSFVPRSTGTGSRSG